MIDQADWLLVAGLVAVSVTITALLMIWYQGERLYQIHRDHVKDMQDLNYEVISLRAQLANRAIRDRVMGSVPVSRLIVETDPDQLVEDLITGPPGTEEKEFRGIEHVIGLEEDS